MALPSRSCLSDLGVVGALQGRCGAVRVAGCGPRAAVYCLHISCTSERSCQAGVCGANPARWHTSDPCSSGPMAGVVEVGTTPSRWVWWTSCGSLNAGRDPQAFWPVKAEDCPRPTPGQYTRRLRSRRVAELAEAL